jgi:hypothetical protein
MDHEMRDACRKRVPLPGCPITRVLGLLKRKIAASHYHRLLAPVQSLSSYQTKKNPSHLLPEYKLLL